MTGDGNLLQELEGLEKTGLDALASVGSEEGLKAWHTAHLGKNSPVMQSFKRLGTVPKEERPAVGQRANKVRQALEAALEEKSESLKQLALTKALQTEKIDVTLPGRRPTLGRLHPITQTLREILAIFADMGFQTYLSPEVETDDYNFTYLNMPPYHPARDMWDTFHTDQDGVVLRTHTSPGQIHAMREYAPDSVRVALPGMCFRYEQVTARAEMQFYQVELLAVGEDITFGDLKGTLQDFARRLFGKEVRSRLRPNYFPFTEPSAEMDIECFICSGEGCSICKGSGWLEILGCGMVHPTVLRYGGYDPEKYSGFAAGMGVERITMLKNSINDIRHFWRNDIRFLEQF
jgi:phenylalanyl-tRNA synthetase alpha chain